VNWWKLFRDLMTLPLPAAAVKSLTLVQAICMANEKPPRRGGDPED
jgi:hypothetical protein